MSTKKNKMVRRCVVIDDATWKAVQEAAKLDQRSAGAYIRKVLGEAVAERSAPSILPC
jgi:hypothetical protein